MNTGRVIRKGMKTMSKKIDLNKFKDVVGQLKTKQQQLKGLMSKETLKEAKKYAEASKQELQKLIRTTDVKKVRSILEREAKEIQKLQKAVPGELAKFAKFVETQRKEFEKILKTVNALEAAEFIQKKVGSKVPMMKKKTKKATKKASAAKEGVRAEAPAAQETAGESGTGQA
jgi:hypothetical protein